MSPRIAVTALSLALLSTSCARSEKETAAVASSPTDTGPVADTETGEPEDTGDTGDTGDSDSTAVPVPPAPTINEIMPRALFSAADDHGEPAGWVELYSSAETAFPLDGWSLRDELWGPEHPLDGLEVPADGHLLLWADGQAEQGPEHLSFELPTEGTWLSLVDPEGQVSELLSFGAIAPDVAASRIPDGGETFQLAYGGTPGAPNQQVLVEELVLLATGDAWRYEDNGLDLGTDWVDPAYDDGAWEAGPSPLGYRMADVVTRVGYGSEEDSKYITTYLRTTVEVAGGSELVRITASVRKDDGVVVYLDGDEIGRLNMPEGEIDYLTPASVAAVGGEQDDYFDILLAPGSLPDGEAVLAAEVHQWDPSTSDMIFDLVLTAERVTPSD